MNSINLLNPRKKSPYKMDPASDRYRKCPNDGVEFMAAHRSEKFCCPKCADEFHNEKKRLEAKELFQDQIRFDLNTRVPVPELLLDKHIEENDLNTRVPVPELLLDKHIEEKKIIQSTKVIVANPLVRNIDLLEETLGNSHSLKVYKDELAEKGLVYDVYDNKYQIPGTELNVLTYGPYAIACNHKHSTEALVIPTSIFLHLPFLVP